MSATPHAQAFKDFIQQQLDAGNVPNKIRQHQNFKPLLVKAAKELVKTLPTANKICGELNRPFNGKFTLIANEVGPHISRRRIPSYTSKGAKGRLALPVLVPGLTE